jgi:hypothetical protein
MHQLESQARLVQQRSHIHSANTQEGRMAEPGRCVVSRLPSRLCTLQKGATSHTHTHYLKTCPVIPWCYKLTAGTFPTGL